MRTSVAFVPRAAGLARTAAVALALCTSGVPSVAWGQAQNVVSSAPRTPQVQLDRFSGAVGRVLPFDEPFVFTGPATPTLLRLDAWYADSTQLNVGGTPLGRAACRATRDTTRLRHTALDHTTWDRGAATRPENATTSFALPVRALGANRTYAFCFISVEALSAADSALFAARAAAGLQDAWRELARRSHGKTVTDATLRALHAALRDALPAADSLYVAPGAFLRPPPVRPTEGSPDDIRRYEEDSTRFATRLRRTYVGLTNALGDGVSAALAESATVTMRHPLQRDNGPVNTLAGCHSEVLTTAGAARYDATCGRPLGWLVRYLASNPALPRVAALRDVIARGPRGERDRWEPALATALGVQTAHTDEVGAQAVAAGFVVVARPVAPAGEITPFTAVEAAADVAPRLAKLDTTAEQLTDLGAFVAYVRANDSLRRSAGLTPEALDTLGLVVNEVRGAATDQRALVRALANELGAFESAVQALAASVVARSRWEIGIVGSTGATYETRARWYVGQDLGVILAARGRDVRQAAPYLGVNIYFRPVNKRAHYGPVCVLDLRCTSLSIGVPTEKWEVADRYSGILAGRALVAGVGTRIGDFFRVAYLESLVYRTRVVPGGTNQRRLDAFPSVSFTLDADLREIIGGVANAIFPSAAR